MPKLYGIEHILYLLFFVAIAVVGVWVVRKYCKTQKQINTIINTVAIALLVTIVTNRISIVITKNNIMRLIPDTFCGLTSLTLAILTLCINNKNHPVFHGIVYLGIVPPLLTMFYPDFIGQASSIWYIPTISGLLHHSISFYLVVLLYITKSFEPSLKKWWCAIFAYTIFLTYGMFLIDGLGFGSAMYIGKPLIEGTIFTWYFVGTAYTVLQVACLYIYERVKQKRLSQ